MNGTTTRFSCIIVTVLLVVSALFSFGAGGGALEDRAYELSSIYDDEEFTPVQVLVRNPLDYLGPFIHGFAQLGVALVLCSTLHAHNGRDRGENEGREPGENGGRR